MSAHEYGKVIDGNGCHLMTCKTGGGPVWTPEGLANTWSGCLQQHSPDTVTATAMISQILWLLTLLLVAHPWNKDILSQAADGDGIASAKREVSKNKKYSSVDAWGDPSNCDPLVFEHFGHWGEPISS